MRLKLGLLGQGISHSRQPRLMSHLARQHGIQIDYALIDQGPCGDTELTDLLESLRRDGYHGINVTHPFKQRVIDFVDEYRSDADRGIGSCNTLLFRDQTVIGANTDYSGFKQGFLARRGQRPPGHVVLCGAGGVGYPIAIALAELGATQISVFDLEKMRSDALCQRIRDHGCDTKSLSTETLGPTMARCDGLVNCTALGMHGHPGSAFNCHDIGAQQWAFDAVYTPMETSFIAAARAAGLEILSGFDLWIYQGVDSFTCFTGESVAVDENLIRETRAWMSEAPEPA